MLTPKQNTLLQNWMALRDQLASVKENEMTLRQQIQNELFPDPREGINALDLGNGWKAKLTAKTNYKLDADEDKVAAVQTAIANIGNEGSFLADRLIKRKQELSVGEYNKLENDEIKALIDSVLTTSPGAPTFEIVEPKA